MYLSDAGKKKGRSKSKRSSSKSKSRSGSKRKSSPRRKRSSSRRRSASKSNENVSFYALMLKENGKEVGRYKGNSPSQAAKKVRNEHFKGKDVITVYLRQTSPGLHKNHTFVYKVSRKKVKANAFMKERTGKNYMYQKSVKFVKELDH